MPCPTAPSCFTCQNASLSYSPESYWEPSDAELECNLSWVPHPSFFTNPQHDDPDVVELYAIAKKCDSYIPTGGSYTIEQLNETIADADNFVEAVGNVLGFFEQDAEMEWCPDCCEDAAEFFVQL